MRVARVENGLGKAKINCTPIKNGNVSFVIQNQNDSVSFSANSKPIKMNSLKDFPRDTHGRYKISQGNYVIESNKLPKSRQTDFCIKRGATLLITSPIELENDTLINFWGEGKLNIDTLKSGKIRFFEEIKSKIEKIEGGSVGGYGVSKNSLNEITAGRFFAGEKSINNVKFIGGNGQFYATQSSKNNIKEIAGGMFQSTEKSLNFIDSINNGKIIFMDSTVNHINSLSKDADLFRQRSAKILA